MKFYGIQKTSLVDFPKTICTTLFTKGCNMRCGYCHNKDLVLPQRTIPAIDIEEIFAHLKAKNGIIEGVCITGGEPTLHRELPSFIRKVKEMGFLVKLDTNGTNPKMVQELLEENLLDYVAMDIKSCKEKYSLVSKLQPKLVQNVFETITILKKSSIPYEFRTTIVRHIHELHDLQSLLKEIEFAPTYVLQRSNNAFALCSQVQKINDFTDTEMDTFVQGLQLNFAGDIFWR